MAQMMDRTIHVRFDGRSEEMSFAQLNLGSDASNTQIKRSVANYFDLPSRSFDEHVIVRTDNAIILRPEAIYG
ncbi:MAG: hypothetical protein JO011_20320 [Ktedonobacteraceae bacterium]|nr:hypothetical protein [Ktedonobacteraceae bacterium]